MILVAELLISVGPKGQVLIPKSLRDEYGISPYGKVVARKEKEGVLISRPKPDAVIESFRRIAFSGKKIRASPAMLKKQFVEGFPKGIPR